MAAMSEYVSSVHIFACLFFSRLNEPFSPPSQIESGDEGGENSERNEFFYYNAKIIFRIESSVIATIQIDIVCSIMNSALFDKKLKFRKTKNRS